MKEFTFTAWCNYGKGDSGESWVDVELTDEEAEKLIKYGTKPEIYYDEFSDCEELQDIYNKVYSIAVEQITDELRDTDWLDEKYKDDPNWRADYIYSCGVNFPNEFEDMLVEEEAVQNAKQVQEVHSESKPKELKKVATQEKTGSIKSILASIPLSILGALEVHLIYGLTNLIVSLLFWLISYIPIIKNIVGYLLMVGDNTADGFAMFVATMLAYLGFMATSEHVIKKGETKKFTLILTGIWLAVFNILFVIINLVYNDPILGNVLLAIAGTIIFFRGKNE